VKGCRTAIEQFSPQANLQIYGNEFSIQNGYVETKMAMLRNPAPTAIFTLSNTILLGAIRALNEQGVKVPDEVSLITFDDNVILDFMNPPITRVAQPIQSMGIAAIKLLTTCIRESRELNSKMLMTPSIIVRDSIKIQL
jgi:LacI family transcriptional regulator